jgi:hypothetical protein
LDVLDVEVWDVLGVGVLDLLGVEKGVVNVSPVYMINKYIKVS